MLTVCTQSECENRKKTLKISWSFSLTLLLNYDSLYFRFSPRMGVEKAFVFMRSGTFSRNAIAFLCGMESGHDIGSMVSPRPLAKKPS